MASPFLGEIRMFGGTFAPAGWAFCNGQLLARNVDTEALFTLIGTTYGGNGTTTFGLPDLRGRVPIHFGQGSGLPLYSVGESGGTESVTLTTQQIGAHTHSAGASSQAGNSGSPNNATWAQAPGTIYSAMAPSVPMSAAAVSFAGGNQPHENVQPILCVSFIMALEGIYPTQN